jgi:hypothetical protein
MPRRIGEGIIQMDFKKKHEPRDGIQLADEGVQWWAFVNMLTNSRAPTVKANLSLCMP